METSEAKGSGCPTSGGVNTRMESRMAWVVFWWLKECGGSVRRDGGERDWGDPLSTCMCSLTSAHT